MARTQQQTAGQEFDQYVVYMTDGMQWICNINYKESVVSKEAMAQVLQLSFPSDRFVIRTEKLGQTKAQITSLV